MQLLREITLVLCGTALSARTEITLKLSTGVMGCRRTAWHSVAASALEKVSQIAAISRAKRSTAMPCWAAVSVAPALLLDSKLVFDRTYRFHSRKRARATTIRSAVHRVIIPLWFWHVSTVYAHQVVVDISVKVVGEIEPGALNDTILDCDHGTTKMAFTCQTLW